MLGTTDHPSVQDYNEFRKKTNWFGIEDTLVNLSNFYSRK